MFFDQQVAQFITSLGYTFSPDFSHPQMKWNNVSDDTLKGAWVYNLHKLKDAEVLIFTIYDYRKAESFTEKFASREITDRERKSIEKQIKAHEEKAREEKERKWKECREYCWTEWESLSPVSPTGHPYLERKGFPNCDPKWGVRARKNLVEGTDLLIPMRDAEGEFWGYQCIREDGKKEFNLGQRLDALFYGLPGTDLSRIYICEGVSTALSIFESLGQRYPVYAAFSASNLKKVATAVREKDERTPIIICPDNDKWKPAVGNTGVRCADEIVSAIGGTVSAVPDFSAVDESTKPTDYNDLHALAGTSEVKRQIESVKINRPHLLFPLGYSDNNFFFTTSEDPQIQRIREFTTTDFLNLRPKQYWEFKYLDGKGGVDWMRAKDDLIRISKKLGIFTPDRVRGRGVYFEAEKLVIHLGDKLYFESGEMKDLSDIESVNIYDPKPKSSLPEKAPHDKAALAEKLVSKFSWEHPFEHKLFLGWNMVAPLSGILEWRPHVSIQAPPGSGKTKVLEIISDCSLRHFSARKVEGVTEAGLRQDIKSDTAPVFIDEVDANSMDEKSFQRLMNLLRVASSGGEILRGTTSGKALRFTSRFSCLLAGVNMPPLNNADSTRVAELELTKNHTEKSWSTFHAELMGVFNETWSRSFFWAVFERARAIQESYLMLREAVAVHTESREGQQYGALLAGYWHWTHTEVIGGPEAQKLVQEFLAWKLAKAGGEKVASESEDCLSHFYTLVLKTSDLRDMLNLGEWLANSKSLAEKNDTLSAFGLKLVKERGLFIASSNPLLKKHFSGTAWPNWGKSLKRLDGVKQGTARFGSAVIRGLFIPYEIKGEEF